MCYISILGFKNTLDYFLSGIRIKKCILSGKSNEVSRFRKRNGCTWRGER